MYLQAYDVSMLTNDIVSIVKNKSFQTNYMFEQAINSIDDRYADEVISSCLDRLLKVDDSLQQLFITTILEQSNPKIKKVLVHVLMKKFAQLASG